MSKITTFKQIRALTRTMQKCDWYLRGSGIRATHFVHQDNAVCPLTFTEKVVKGMKEERYCAAAGTSGQNLGFSNELCFDIMVAADYNTRDLSRHKLRRILLKAARLKENEN